MYGLPFHFSGDENGATAVMERQWTCQKFGGLHNERLGKQFEFCSDQRQSVSVPLFAQRGQIKAARTSDWHWAYASYRHSSVSAD
jgi:hypothetical protein